MPSSSGRSFCVCLTCPSVLKFLEGPFLLCATSLLKMPKLISPTWTHLLNPKFIFATVHAILLLEQLTGISDVTCPRLSSSLLLSYPQLFLPTVLLPSCGNSILMIQARRFGVVPDSSPTPQIESVCPLGSAFQTDLESDHFSPSPHPTCFKPPPWSLGASQ